MPLSKEALEAKKLKEQAKIREYLALTDDVLNRVSTLKWSLNLLTNFLQKKQNDWSKEALQITTQLLQINPEFYTIWNYRRNILLNGIFPQR